MKKESIVSIIVCMISIIAALIAFSLTMIKESDARLITVGFIYDGDESAPYSYNFIRAQKAIENEYDERVNVIVKSNISEADAEEALAELVIAGCDLIFSTSYGYGEAAKSMAYMHPEVEFCQATCSNSSEDCPNYHTFMGEIYSGRYIAGRAAGMKLKELITEGSIAPDEAKIGYVAAFPYAEVISGYTAFFLGVREEVPEAVMNVRYTGSWADYVREKECAEKLIEEGCVVISQHSDTIGPAVACENAAKERNVIHVGYNDSMLDVAPTTSLISSRINWTPYMLAAAGAVLEGKKIEKCVDARVNGYDCSAGFDRDWVQMVELNDHIAAEGTAEMIAEVTGEFKKGHVIVFKGNYTGTDPFDKNDTYDLSNGYIENENSSAPSFHYVLDEVIRVEE